MALAWDFTLPDVVARPGILALLLVYCSLGLALWNCVFAAFAATIDDPNTSARTSFMFLPIMFVAVACYRAAGSRLDARARAGAVPPSKSAC